MEITALLESLSSNPQLNYRHLYPILAHDRGLCIRTVSFLEFYPAMEERPLTIGRSSPRSKLIDKAAFYHHRIPLLKTLPFNAVFVIVFLIFVNIIIWIAVGIVLVSKVILYRSFC